MSIAQTATWTSSTAQNTTVEVDGDNTGTVLVSILISGSITAGQINFEASDDLNTWYSALGVIQGSFTVFTNWQPAFGAPIALQFSVPGFAGFRCRLATALTGTGSVTVNISNVIEGITTIVFPVQQNGANLHFVLDDSAGGNAVNTVAKNTQGTRALTVQDMKDSGRTYVSFTIDAIAGVTSEALSTMTINKAETVSSATSYTVTTGKTLRIQAMSATVRATTTTALTSGKIRLRSAASAISATSPIVAALDITPPTAAAAAGASGYGEMSFPDGIEIAGTHQIAVSQVISSTSSAVTVTVVGYEY
jgi:hypothetical protein